jgi:hypothetical protein
MTDVNNGRSLAAIAKLGATREATLRRHMRRADGSWRDSVIFSVLVEEWPNVRTGLEQRITGELVPPRQQKRDDEVSSSFRNARTQ